MVGFRTVAIVDGVFTVNGAPVKLRGVNRHEFEPRSGRAVTPEAMLEDVLAMKRHHVNAVRTSHYPPHPHFLDLCDAHGLYVIDENDLETHGFEPLGWHGNPTDDPAWTDVLVDRVTRMVRRDAHHPSIVLWSLGNEAGSGRNLASMAAAIRDLDPSRPLHYEGDWSSAAVDVYSRMYPSFDELEQIVLREEDPLPDGALDARRRAMPFVLCEYAHAMGNGPGGLGKHADLVDDHPRMMGAFVWEWKDHGVATQTPDGASFFGYGGDFGEELHDGTFIADGLMLPDRTPSPGLVELAAVYAPLSVRPPRTSTGVGVGVGAEVGGALEVRNRYAFRSAAHAVLRWAVVADGDTVLDGEADVLGDLAPGEALVLRVEDVAPQWRDVVPTDTGVWWVVTAAPRDAGDLVTDRPSSARARPACAARLPSTNRPAPSAAPTTAGMPSARSSWTPGAASPASAPPPCARLGSTPGARRPTTTCGHRGTTAPPTPTTGPPRASPGCTSGSTPSGSIATPSSSPPAPPALRPAAGSTSSTAGTPWTTRRPTSP